MPMIGNKIETSKSSWLLFLCVFMRKFILPSASLIEMGTFFFKMLVTLIQNASNNYNSWEYFSNYHLLLLFRYCNGENPLNLWMGKQS